ncbi:hypothetical protein L0668_07125 [Paraglaciecola aquimarina]|uniref:6-bladed beta-propeller n=1 Tax=Paraglaciecola algarum TaxID=3050085 RepID=A0ABS9D783_9ALTE|nr:hypothetical protein [Paraglaciecola sp. G1-23]MCF2947872.1 hypothetical protein [Paraglaciecola sp. G1-23]
MSTHQTNTFPRLFLAIFSSVLISSNAFSHAHGPSHKNSLQNAEYKLSAKWSDLADGSHAVGNSHGEIDVAKSGDVYVSIMGEKGGVQIYSPQGEYKSNVPNAPKDLHGFVIHLDADGQEYIYAAQLDKKRIIKMHLNGVKVLDIDATQVIPTKFHNPNKDRNALSLTAADVDQDGNIYVVDGYSRDFIHKLNPKGEYIASFGGKDAPYNFNNCHKISIDPRFKPNRILCTDRNNARLVHMQLDGSLIGTFADDLRRPSAVDFYGDKIVVAEIKGRVSVLDKQGKVLVALGTNEVANEISTNKVSPEKWREGVFTSPHGITFDHQGNIYITEWNKWGRILRFDLTH